LVEQNIGLISHVAQRAYAMDKGRIVATLAGDAIQSRDVLVEHLAI
jgi:ABC-type branched-subunit amino acid transport system ATPase component